MSNERASRRRSGLLWLAAGMVASLASHGLAVFVSVLSGLAMRGTSRWAVKAAAAIDPFDEPYRWVAFVAMTAFSLAYLAPVARFFNADVESAPPLVRRRVLGTPLFLSVMALIPWVGGIVWFVCLMLARFGQWNIDLTAEHVLAPIISGFLAATGQYLFLEWITREKLVPLVFPEGRLSGEESAWTLPVGARLSVLAVALGLVPAFTLLGLVMAASDRIAAGFAPAATTKDLVTAAQQLFAFFAIMGAGYAVMFARSLTRPLRLLAGAVEDVQHGRLDVRVPVRSRDEVGALSEAVNALASTLQDRDHILRTFGRIVDPHVRDRLLSGNLSSAGEERDVALLFADVRAFTDFAARNDAASVVVALNALFSAMTAEVRAAGGYVDKFVGDAMLAVFGLFDEDADRAAAAAVRCALALRDRIATFANAADGRTPLRVAVAVHAGNVLAGTLGAEDRFDYTVVGDAVNVTSRLLEVCKEKDHDLILSQQTFARARIGGADAQIDWSGEVRLRGRHGTIQACTIAPPPAH